MSTTMKTTPTSRVRFGLARTDITPPVGIYHRMWGAARHDQATGVHRPLTAEVMVFGPMNESPSPHIRVQLDLVGLGTEQVMDLRQKVADACGVPADHVLITFSHTHAAGLLTPDRYQMPGGELIPPYLQRLASNLEDACRRALAGMQEAVVTYAFGRCDLAANRDYWDDANDLYACGYNPDAPADDTVLVARITGPSGQVMATVVNYACHPTSLAWENTLISPDYVGAMREEVEQVTGAPCVFALGACGDLGPRHGYVGDTAVADRNGRQLAYAALSALSSIGPPAQDFHYTGPVVSGATLGAWAYAPLSEERLEQASHFSGITTTVDLPLKPKPDSAQMEADLALWEARRREAEERGDAKEAHDASARAERARRWLSRLSNLPEGATFPFRFSALRMGDAVWVTTSGEPYNLIQTELRRRFPDYAVLFSPLAGGVMQVAYLLTEDRYGKGLYQEEPSILASGCLEALIEAVAACIGKLVD